MIISENTSTVKLFQDDFDENNSVITYQKIIDNSDKIILLHTELISVKELQTIIRMQLNEDEHYEFKILKDIDFENNEFITINFNGLSQKCESFEDIVGFANGCKSIASYSIIEHSISKEKLSLIISELETIGFNLLSNGNDQSDFMNNFGNSVNFQRETSIEDNAEVNSKEFECEILFILQENRLYCFIKEGGKVYLKKHQGLDYKKVTVSSLSETAIDILTRIDRENHFNKSGTNIIFFTYSDEYLELEQIQKILNRYADYKIFNLNDLLEIIGLEINKDEIYYHFDFCDGKTVYQRLISQKNTLVIPELDVEGSILQINNETVVNFLFAKNLPTESDKPSELIEKKRIQSINNNRDNKKGGNKLSLLNLIIQKRG